MEYIQLDPIKRYPILDVHDIQVGSLELDYLIVLSALQGKYKTHLGTTISGTISWQSESGTRLFCDCHIDAKRLIKSIMEKHNYDKATQTDKSLNFGNKLDLCAVCMDAAHRIGGRSL